MLQEEIDIPLEVKQFAEKLTSRVVGRLKDDRKKLALQSKLATIQSLLTGTKDYKKCFKKASSSMEYLPGFQLSKSRNGEI